jgi:hypothetical protein
MSDRLSEAAHLKRDFWQIQREWEGRGNLCGGRRSWFLWHWELSCSDIGDRQEIWVLKRGLWLQWRVLRLVDLYVLRWIRAPSLGLEAGSRALGNGGGGSERAGGGPLLQRGAFQACSGCLRWRQQGVVDALLCVLRLARRARERRKRGRGGCPVSWLEGVVFGRCCHGMRGCRPRQGQRVSWSTTASGEASSALFLGEGVFRLAGLSVAGRAPLWWQQFWGAAQGRGWAGVASGERVDSPFPCQGRQRV